LCYIVITTDLLFDPQQDLLPKSLDESIPKKDQSAFIEAAVSERLKKQKDMNAETIELYVDGGSRGNPGPAGGGFVIYPPDGHSIQGSEFYGTQTNNQAEYLALRSALREAFTLFPQSKVHCFMDSQLVVEQMNGNYKVKSPNVKSLHEEVRRIADQFKNFRIGHVRREKNRLADKLANEAMDRAS